MNSSGLDSTGKTLKSMAMCRIIARGMPQGDQVEGM
jgi:hypothetical protein